jgi:uncharacterized repeat protein (TIGR01451 family)
LGVTAGGNNNPAEGESFLISIQYTNQGSTAYGVVVTSPIPSGFMFISATGAPFDPATGTWTVGTLINGQNGNLQLTITGD